jgi:hypothetical protein
MLALRVIAKNPRTVADSNKALREVLEKEGYVDQNSPNTVSLRIDVANAAREIMDERSNRRRVS